MERPNVVEATPRSLYWVGSLLIMIVLMILFGFAGCYTHEQATEDDNVIDNVIVLSIAAFILANILFWLVRWIWVRLTWRDNEVMPEIATEAQPEPSEPVNKAAARRREKHAARLRKRGR